MNASFFGLALIFAACVVGSTLFFLRFRTVGLAFFVVMAALFPFFSDTTHWDHWFDWVKRYSVAVPICLWAWVLWQAERGGTGAVYHWAVKLIPFVLLANVTEVALKEIGTGAWVNATFLVVLCITMPWKWETDSKQMVGFEDWPWVTALTVSLTVFYVLDPGFKNVFFGAVAVLWVSYLVPVVLRNTQTWFTWRAYTLAYLIYQDSMADWLSDYLYPPLLHADSRIRLQGTAFEYSLLALTGVLVVAVLVDRAKRLRARMV